VKLWKLTPFNEEGIKMLIEDGYQSSYICIYELPLFYLRENKDSVNWRHVCAFQDLNDEIITEFQDYDLDWLAIATFQNISLNFIKSNFDKFKNCLENEDHGFMNNGNYSDEDKEQIKDIFESYQELI